MATNEQTAKPKRARTRGPQHHLSPAQEREIIDAYVSGVSLHTYARQHGLTDTYGYRILEKHHVTWRRGSEQTFEDWLKDHPEVHLPDPNNHAPQPAAKPGPKPHTVEQKLDAIIAEGQPQPGTFVPVISYVEDDTDRSNWLIEITEKFVIRETSIDAALAQAKQLRPGARITSIRIKP